MPPLAAPSSVLSLAIHGPRSNKGAVALITNIQSVSYRAIKTNIADSLNIIIQIERRRGARFVSQVLEIRGYNVETDRYDLQEVWMRGGSSESPVRQIAVSSP